MNLVYQTDHRVAELCRDMSIAGFAFDASRAREFSAFLLDAETKARQAADGAVGRKILSGPSGGFSNKDLAKAFFGDMRAPVIHYSELSGRPSLNVDALRAYSAGADPDLRNLAIAVLEFRRARKVRVTYIDRPLLALLRGRIHPSWLSYGAETGRLSCQGPNLANLPSMANDPTRELGGIRSLYLAPEGRRLVVWDAKQLEMRVAAYVTGDEAMIAACNSLDMHSSNAVICFGDGFDAERYEELSSKVSLSADEKRELVGLKGLRTLAKSGAFAVCYMAEAETVWARIVASGLLNPPPELRMIEMMLQRMKREFHGYYEWQERNYLKIMKSAHAFSPLLGRPRFLSHDPETTKAANYPIQSGAADLMNIRLPLIEDALRRRVPGSRIVAQVYDSAAIECDERHVEEVKEISKSIFEAPIVISTSGRDIEASFPIDVEDSVRWH